MTNSQQNQALEEIKLSNETTELIEHNAENLTEKFVEPLKKEKTKIK